MKPKVILDTNIFVKLIFSQKPNSEAERLRNLLLKNKFNIVIFNDLKEKEYDVKIKLVAEKYKDKVSMDDTENLIKKIFEKSIYFECLDIHNLRIADEGMDDMIASVAVNLNIDYVITHNIKDFLPFKNGNIKKYDNTTFLILKEFLKILES